jgi:Arc/MetJ-type ribon-helix-helix transcriptional regulator
MNVLNLRLRHDIQDWIDAKVAKGEFASAEDYLSELVERDRESRSDDERIEEIRQMIADAERGETSTRRAMDRIAEGQRRLRARGIVSG